MEKHEETNGINLAKRLPRAIIPAIWIVFSVFIIWLLLFLLYNVGGRRFD